MCWCVKMGIAERKKREREQRRKKILDAAEKLFFMKYYDAVSMDEIAIEVELSKPTLYQYFRDKESLFLAIVERGLRIWYDMTRAAVKDADNGIDQLAAIGLANHRFTKTFPEYYKIFTYFRSSRFIMKITTGNDAIESVYHVMQEIGEITDSAIQIGIEDGTLRSDIDPVMLSVFLTTFSDSVNNLNPRLINKLEVRGIRYDQFINEFINLMYNMMENPDHKVQRRTQQKPETAG